LEPPLLETHGFLAATVSSSSVTTGSSGIGHYLGCGTVRTNIADSRVAPDEEREPKQGKEEYENRMLRPGFEPGISDSKGRYA
jgi:hypothetical protein